jgi:predicted acyltransferase
MSANRAPQRLQSLDALRGADLFWIVGGHALVAGLASATGSPTLEWIEAQCHHVPWHGFKFYDLIFPLFLFLAGVSLPLSITARQKRGQKRSEIRRHALIRATVLVALGVAYNTLGTGDREVRYASVLGRIGLGWLGAALLVIEVSPRAQWRWFFGLLGGYAFLLLAVPAPGMQEVSLAQGETIVDWFDRTFLPGRLHRGTGDPEGLLSTLPSVATALAGVFAGRWLTSRGPGPALRLTVLVLAGLLALGIGHWLDPYLPINKNLWTPTFVFWCAGWSLLLLALFHALIDLPGARYWHMPLVVLGANSILIYLLTRWVDFEGLFVNVLGWALPDSPPSWALAAGALALELILLGFLYSRRAFLRV